ncbi:MAG: Ig-like domain-containing protein [Terriglobales bacterium]
MSTRKMLGECSLLQFNSLMLNKKKRTVQVGAAMTAFLVLVVGSGCTGFFVNPTLTSITVGPTATIEQGNTVRESAVGTYNDGTTKTLGSGVQWSSSPTTIASVDSSGLVSGVSPGSATITAAFQTTTGTSNITVSLGNVTGLKISPTSANIAVNGSQPFSALATVSGVSAPVDVSSTATWTIGDPSNFTITLPTTAGDPVTITAGSGATPGEAVQLTATYNSTTIFTATAIVTVTQ